MSNPYCRRYDEDECGGCDVGAAEATTLGLTCFESVDEVTRESPDDGSAMFEEDEEDE